MKVFLHTLSLFPFLLHTCLQKVSSDSNSRKLSYIYILAPLLFSRSLPAWHTFVWNEAPLRWMCPLLCCHCLIDFVLFLSRQVCHRSKNLKLPLQNMLWWHDFYLFKGLVTFKAVVGFIWCFLVRKWSKMWRLKDHLKLWGYIFDMTVMFL